MCRNSSPQESQSLFSIRRVCIWSEYAGCLNEMKPTQTTGKVGFGHLFDWWAQPTIKSTWQHLAHCTTMKHLYTCSTLLIHHYQTNWGITSGYKPSVVLLQTGLYQRKNAAIIYILVVPLVALMLDKLTVAVFKSFWCLWPSSSPRAEWVASKQGQ